MSLKKALANITEKDIDKSEKQLQKLIDWDIAKNRRRFEEIASQMVKDMMRAGEIEKNLNRITGAGTVNRRRRIKKYRWKTIRRHN